MRDPYAVLGVPKGAEIKEIKKAYRKLARDLHPDLHPGDPKAEERFKEVAVAYDLLSDPEKKARYDRGEIDASGAPKADRRFYRDYAEAEPGNRYTDPGQFFRDFEGTDIFAELFRGKRREARARGLDVRQEIEVEFLDAVNGATREMVLPDGRKVKVTIPPGTQEGQVLRLRGQGMPGTGGGASAGDLHLEVKVRPDPRMRREGTDIFAELPITLPEAVLGGKIAVPTADGTVSLTIPRGSNSGMRLRVRGKGAPPPGGGPRGDYYVTLQVILPERIDPEIERFVREWAERHPYRVRDR